MELKWIEIKNVVFLLHSAHPKSSTAARGQWAPHHTTPHRSSIRIPGLVDFVLFCPHLLWRDGPCPHQGSTNKILLCSILFHRTHWKKTREQVENLRSVGRERGSGLGQVKSVEDGTWVGLFSYSVFTGRTLPFLCLGIELRMQETALVVMVSPVGGFPWAPSTGLVTNVWVWHLQNGKSSLLLREKKRERLWNPKHEATVKKEF